MPSAYQSPEDHLALGISLHEQGNLPKSTYHLRLAARAELPNAMLLYALACRHGWGIRRNEAEAFIWLRRAVDISGLDLAASSSTHPRGATAHQTSLALAIFELGMSYLHGWGAEKDASQALRMFEVAGNLGDVDAVVKAAECYRDGAGCKRDLQKAADQMKRAESMGVVLVGESWVRKEKYCIDEKRNDGDIEIRIAEKEKTTEKRAKAIFRLGR